MLSLGPTIVFTCVIVALILLMGIVRKDSYRRGQVDALSGRNIQYELTLQDDSTRVWVEKEDQ